MRNLHLFFATLFLLASPFSYAHVWNVVAETSGADYPSASDACQARADFRTSTGGCTGGAGTYCVGELENMGETSGTCKTYSNTGFSIQGALLSRASGCSAGYVDDGTGTGSCIEQAECPLGQFNYGSGCENICTAGNETKAWYECSDPNSLTHYEDAGDGGSCEYEFTSLTVADVGFTADDIAMCNSTYTSTGNYVPEVLYGDPNPEPPTTGTTDTRENITEKTVSDQQVTNHPDGSTTEEQTTTETKVEAEGTVIWESNGKIYIQDSTGTITTTTQQELIQQAADNSYTETITEEVSVTTPTKNTTIIDNTNKQISNVDSSGKTSTSSKTTVNTYGTGGALVSSTSVESGTAGSGGVDDGMCDPELQDCGEGEWSDYQPGDKSGLYEKTDKTFQSVITDFKDRVSASSLGTSMTNFFNVSLGGSCPVWSASVWVFDITIDQQCSTAMSQVWPYIAAVLLLMAGFFAWRVAIDD